MNIKNYLLFFSFLIFNLACLTFPLQATFSKEEQELLRETNRTNIKKILDKHIGDNHSLLNSSKEKDIIAILGKTGAGKSTLINYLTEKELIVEGRKIILKNPNDLTAMKIGGGSVSETFLPKFIHSNDFIFYDLAGFGDTRGTAISLVNACFIKNIIENAQSVRLVFVCGQDEITAERGKIFKELFEIIKNLIPNENIEDFSSLVITKSLDSKKDLIEELKSDENLKQFLEPWLKKEKISSMTRLKLEKEERIDILNTIKSISPIKISNVNINVVYSDKELSKLKNIYSEEIEDNADILIKSKYNLTSPLSSFDIESLENKKQYFQNRFLKELSSFLDTSALIRLLNSIAHDTYRISWKEMKRNISLRIENITNLIEIEMKEQQKKKEEENSKLAKCSIGNATNIYINTPYKIRNVGNSGLLDTYGNNEDGAPLKLGSCNHQSTHGSYYQQLFQLDDQGNNQYKIRNVGNNGLLDTYGNNEDGAPLKLGSCNHQSTHGSYYQQLFQLDDQGNNQYKIRNVGNNGLLDTYGNNEDGAPLKFGRCNHQPMNGSYYQQLFKFDSQ